MYCTCNERAWDGSRIGRLSINVVNKETNAFVGHSQ